MEKIPVRFEEEVLALYREVISMYHTTRLSECPAEVHVASKPTVRAALERLLEVESFRFLDAIPSGWLLMGLSQQYSDGRWWCCLRRKEDNPPPGVTGWGETPREALSAALALTATRESS